MDQKLKAVQAEQSAQQANCAAPAESYPQTVGLMGDNYEGRPRFTLRQEAEERVGFHRSQAEKADSAAAFFRENPAFDEFIRLVRSGAIQF